MVRVNLMVTPDSHIPRTIAGMMNRVRLVSGSFQKETKCMGGDHRHQTAGRIRIIVPNQKLGMQMNRIAMLRNIWSPTDSGFIPE